MEDPAFPERGFRFLAVSVRAQTRKPPHRVEIGATARASRPSPVRSQAILPKRDADPVLPAPHHLARTAATAGNLQIEFSGNAKLACDFDRSAGVGDIAHDTVDRAAVELDPARFQNSLPRRAAFALHIDDRLFGSGRYVRALGRRLLAGVLRRGHNRLIGEQRLDPGPCELEAKLAVL